MGWQHSTGYKRKKKRMEKAMQYFKQVQLEKKERDRLEVTTTWIPEQFAHQTRWVRLKNRTGEWVSGWQIVHVGKRRVHEDELKQVDRQYLTTSDVMDI